MSKPLFIEQQLKPEHMEEGYPVTVSFEKLMIQKFLVNNPITFNLFDDTTAGLRRPFEFSCPLSKMAWPPHW